MNRIFRILICILLAVLTIINSYESVYAYYSHNNYETYVDENWNVVTRFDFDFFINDTNDAHRVVSDLSKADEFYFRYKLSRDRCCSNAETTISGDYVDIYINGNKVHHDDKYIISENSYSGRSVEVVKDLRNYRTSSGIIDIEAIRHPGNCPYCGGRIIGGIYMGDPMIYDMRGSASNIPSSISVQVFTPTSIKFDFNEYTSRVQWVVKYKGDSSFTTLKEGINRDGLVASSVTSTQLNLSNVPVSLNGAQIGALAYDADGQLPGNTAFPDTPFYTTVNVTDPMPPTLEVNKKIDTTSKSVIIEAIASDNAGLSDKPYSFDGGNTFEALNTKAITSPGIITVAVKDALGNITKKEISVDAIDIEKANPKTPSTDEGIKNSDTDTGKGNSGNSGDSNSGIGGSSGTGDNKGNPGGNSAGTGTLDKAKDKNKEFISSDKTVNDTIKTVEQTKKTNNKNTSKNNSKSNNSKYTSLKAKELTDKDKEDVFERIRKNSEDYIISMRETKKDEPKAADGNKATIELKAIEEGKEADAYTNENGNEADAYNPETKEKSMMSLVLIFVGLILLLIVLSIILFFGVIVFVKKDTEYTMLSNEEGIKVPVALLFVSFKNSERSLCFYELLNKYDDLYVRFGPLFSYIYENEKISIMTKFKGEKKREIAKEIIAKEIVVGKTGGKKR